MNKFRELGIIEPILQSIEEQHFKEPTDIQAKTIPLVLQGKDVIGGSKTGSGKTLIFGCGIIQKLERGKGVQALVLVPTRELALQVSKALALFSKHKPLNITTVYGGVSINPQIHALPSSDVVIGTPGRILDHLERGTINLKKVKVLVLDEADMMLDLGFLYDVEKIISQIPRERQTLLFSATVSNDIDSITQRHMHNPIKISVEEYVDPSQLTQFYFDVPSKKKFPLLVHLLRQESSDLVMVFCNTRRNTDFVAKNLKLNGIQVRAIHGGLTQSKRELIMKDFHQGKLYVLACTDVASRGLDIPGVSHVYNYDTCKDSKQYIHRIGRTARAGKDGKAITLLSEKDHDNFSKVLRYNDVAIDKLELPFLERVEMNLGSGRGRFGGRGPRRDGFRGGQGHGHFGGSRHSSGSRTLGNFRHRGSRG